MERFHHKFKQLRVHLRLTQVEFAAMLKITQANVSQLEGGKCLPTGETFLKLLQLYPDLDFNWLIKGLSGSPFRKQGNYDLFLEKDSKKLQEDMSDKGLFD